MSLKEQIEADFKVAMREKNEVAVSSLRLLKSEILVLEKTGKPVGDEEVMKVLQSLVKKFKEAAEAYKTAGRGELEALERKQLAIVEKYLPAQLSPEEVKVSAKKILDNLDPVVRANFGAAMGAVMKELKNQASGDVVRQVVQELL